MKSIIFSTENVEALLDRRKTQSRRVVKVPRGHVFNGADLTKAWPDNTSPFGPCLKVPCAEDTVQRLFCPYGSVGDRLYVKEAHWRWGIWQPSRQRPSGWRFLPVGRHGPPVLFRLSPGAREAEREEIGWHKRSPLYLPREHSRLTLELDAVRFQRLQEISETDAQAEGVGESAFVHESNPAIWAAHAHERYRLLFTGRWDAINSKRPGCSWEDDPWVVALTLRPCS